MVTVAIFLLACTGSDGPSSDSRVSGGDSADGGVDTDTAEVPEDGDGDGYRPEEGDCDDTDARVHPGAPDGCDAVDQDCDGVAQPAGSCSGPVSLDSASAAAWVGDGPGSVLAIKEADTDYDGDGIIDILAYENCTSWADSRWCNQNVVMVPGRIPDGEEALPAAGSPFWIADPGHDWASDFGSAGDFDGDGSIDLFITARGCTPADGSVYLMLGPSTRWPTAGATTRAAADGWWAQATPDDCFADAASGGYDADGDGLDDLLVNGAQIALIRGRTSDLTRGMPIHDEVWFEGDSDRIALLPDIDGDGLGDVALRYRADENMLALVSPTAISDGSAGAPIADVADMVGLGVDVSFNFFEGRSELGDVDGDGLTDIALTVARDLGRGAPADNCSAILFGSGSLRSDTLDTHLDRLVCIDDEKASSEVGDGLTDDLDGDAIPDIIVNAPYGYGERSGLLACLVASSRRPQTGWEMLEDVRPYCFDVEGAQDWSGAAVDLDGDGVPELLGSELSFDDYRGHILVAPGFDIPFDDDTRW